MITRNDLIKAIMLNPSVIEHLSDDALVMLEMETVKRRDMREPKRREKLAFEKEFFKLLRKRFRRQKQKFLQRLQIMTGRKDYIYTDWLDYFFEDDEQNQEEIALRGRLVSIIARAMQAGINLFGDEININYDWTVVNTRALEYASRYTYDLIRGIDQTTVDALRRQVSAFVQTPGMTLGDLSTSLPFNDRRALTIAVTETTRAYAQGQRIAGDQLKQDYPDLRVTKTWFTNNDERVCEICEPLNGTTVDIDEQFGDGLDTPPAHPNCRCWISTRTRING